MSVTPSKQVLRHLNRPCLAGRASIYDRNISTNIGSCHTHRPSKRQQARQYESSKSVLDTTTSSLRTPISHLCRNVVTTASSSSSSPSTKSQVDQEPTTSPPDITNYYTLFPSTLPNGPPSSSSSSSSSSAATTQTQSTPFTISLPALRKEFLSLQSKYHPDKYDPSTQAHQKALALSSLINTAYKTLSDPLLRAQYLLQLNYDIDVTNEDNAAHPTDQETLMDVMDAQERIEEAESQQEIDVLKDENLERIKRTIEKMSQAFETGDVVAAKDECVRLKYWHSLQQGLIEWEPGKEVRLIH